MATILILADVFFLPRTDRLQKDSHRPRHHRSFLHQSDPASAAISDSIMLRLVLTAIASASLVVACDPTTVTSCPPIPAMPSSVTYSLSTTNTADFSYVMSDRIVADGSSLQFSVDAQGDAPTIITNDYLLYGNVKATVKSAPGVGMVSAFILMSDVLDEIDLEWLGAYDNQVQTNYYYRGETANYDRGGVTTVTTPEESSHVYEIDWTETTLNWLVDGVVIRTLNKANTTGYGYPSTPCQIKIGVWASGDPTNAEGTIEWGGGLINYTAGPYTMTLSSLEVISYTTAESFSYANNGTTVLISQNEASSSSSATKSVSSSTAALTSTSTHAATAVDVVKAATSSGTSTSTVTRAVVSAQSSITITAASTTLTKAATASGSSKVTSSSSSGSLASTSTSLASRRADLLGVSGGLMLSVASVLVMFVI